MSLCHASVAQMDKPAVKRHICPSQKARQVSGKIESQCGNLFRCRHPADRLRMGEFIEHFHFSAWIVCPQKAIHEWCVDPSRRDTVAADVLINEVLRY